MSAPRHHITFGLGGELFAIDVVHVREVLDLTEITRVPSAPAYMRGVVNVRGSAVPIIDLRQRFGLPAAPDTIQTRILVLEVDIDGEHTVVGGLADSVLDVVEIQPEDITEAPRIAMRWRSELMTGMCKQGDRFVIVLDVDRLFSLESIALPPEAELAAAAAS